MLEKRNKNDWDMWSKNFMIMGAKQFLCLELQNTSCDPKY